MRAPHNPFHLRLAYYDQIVDRMRTANLRPDQAAAELLPAFLKQHGPQPWAAQPFASEHARTMPGGLAPEALPGKEGRLVAPGRVLLWLAMAALDVPGASLFDPDEQITADIARQVAESYHPRAVFTAPIVTPQHGPGHQTGDRGAAGGLIRAVCFDGAWIWGLGEMEAAFARDLTRGAFPHISVLLRPRRDVGDLWYLVNLLATAEEPGIRGMPSIQEQLVAALGHQADDPNFGAPLARTHRAPVIARTFIQPHQEESMSDPKSPPKDPKAEKPKQEELELKDPKPEKPEPKDTQPTDPQPEPTADPARPDGNPSQGAEPSSAADAPPASAPPTPPSPKARTYPAPATERPAASADPRVEELTRTVQGLTTQVQQLMADRQQSQEREAQALERTWSAHLEQIGIPAGDRPQQLEVLRAVRKAGGDPQAHLDFLARSARNAGREQLMRTYIPASNGKDGKDGEGGHTLAVPPELRIPGREAEVAQAVQQLHRTADKDGHFNASRLLGGGA